MNRLRSTLLIGVLALASAASAAAQESAPVKAIRERGANPRGPFAKISLSQRDSIIESAKEQIGIRYKWAGINPEKGLDCSGFVKYVFAKLGVELPHSSKELATLGGSIARDTAEMRPGDLLVFGKGKRISHVGIYVGDGKMIHASSRSGAVVEASVVKARPPQGLQWKGVRRVVAVDSAITAGTPQN
jgi:cell wall-associated NlpC family hydrolase